MYVHTTTNSSLLYSLATQYTMYIFHYITSLSHSLWFFFIFFSYSHSYNVVICHLHAEWSWRSLNGNIGWIGRWKSSGGGYGESVQVSAAGESREFSRDIVVTDENASSLFWQFYAYFVFLHAFWQYTQYIAIASKGCLNTSSSRNIK